MNNAIKYKQTCIFLNKKHLYNIQISWDIHKSKHQKTKDRGTNKNNYKTRETINQNKKHGKKKRTMKPYNRVNLVLKIPKMP